MQDLFDYAALMLLKDDVDEQAKAVLAACILGVYEGQYTYFFKGGEPFFEAAKDDVEKTWPAVYDGRDDDIGCEVSCPSVGSCATDCPGAFM